MNSQISLENIMSFLMNNEKIETKIRSNKLKYLENLNSKYFTFFNNIFKNNVERVGIYPKESIYFSILYILDDDFCLLSKDDQYILIKELKFRIISDFNSKLFKIPNCNKKKIKIIENENDNKFNIQVLASFFKINIYVFSESNNTIDIYADSDELNLYKLNIFINEVDNTYYPLTYKHNNGKYFKFNSHILQNILNSHYIKSKYSVENDWKIILKDYLDLDLSNVIINLDTNLIFSDDENEITSFSEEFNKINHEIKNSEINNDFNLSSDSSEINDKIILEINDNSSELINELKLLSDSKFLSFKKDKLIDYLNELKIDLPSNNTKKSLISCIKNELKKHT